MTISNCLYFDVFVILLNNKNAIHIFVHLDFKLQLAAAIIAANGRLLKTLTTRISHFNA